VVRLGEVARIDRRSVQPEDIADGQVYLGLEHIETGGHIAKANAVNAGDLKSSKFAFDTRHVLFGKLRPNLAKVARPPFEGVCSTDIVPILPGPNLDRDYLANFLLTPQIVDWASSRTSGVNLPRLSPSVLEGLEIPLPPLPDQRRIASILDEVDALRTARRTAISRSGLVIAEALSGISASSDLTELGDLVEEFRYGTSAKSGPTGLPVLRIPNVSRRSLDFTDLKFVELPQAEVDRLKLHPGDLLIVRSNGNPDLVGATAMFQISDQKTYVYASYLIRARPRRSVVPIYLAHYLSSPAGRAALRAGARTSAGQYNINTKALAAIKVPVPALAVQLDFAEKVQLLERSNALMRAHLAKLDELFAALQHRAFRG
jgi:type I restriction enzyme S subunit